MDLLKIKIKLINLSKADKDYEKIKESSGIKQRISLQIL